jgi:hypothetical protein
MEEIQRVINLNNNGVALLELNDLSHAVQLFQIGIQSIKQCTIHIPSSTFKEMTMPQELVPSLTNEFNDIPYDTSFSMGTRIQGMQRGICYTFDRPLIIDSITSPLMTFNTEEFESKFYFVTTILFFNFALASHQYALRCGKCSSLQLAARMYNIAANFIRETDFDRCTGEIILCLIMNNMASLHFELCDFKRCESDLKCIHNSLSDDKYLDVIVMQFLDEDEWVQLKLNYFYFQLPVVAQAA